MRKLLFFSAMLIAVSTGPKNVFVQVADAKSQSNICMVRMSTGAGDQETPFTIIVKANRRSGFESRGYSSVNCNGKRGQLANYKQQICYMAGKAPPPVQANFQRVHGASPNELCQAVSGP